MEKNDSVENRRNCAGLTKEVQKQLKEDGI